MNRIFGIFVSIIFYSSFINTTIACEFLKEQIGTSISNLTEKYDLLDDPSDADNQDITFVKEYDSVSLCDDIELDNATIKVFVREGKLIGNEVEGKNGEAKMRKIFSLINKVLFGIMKLKLILITPVQQI